MPSDNANDMPLPFPSEKFREKWEEWLQYRRERRLPPYKPLGLKKVFDRLIRISNGYEPTALDMIEQAMGNYWIGIYPLQKDYYGTAKNTQPGASDSRKGTSSERINRAKNW